MDTSKEGIKAWLASYPDRDRNWLAEKCGVSKNTVNNWLSTSIELPSKTILIIENLMRADAEAQPGEPVKLVNLPVECSPAQFDLYTRAFRRSEQEHFRDWITTRLDAAADEELGLSSASITPMPPRANLLAAAGSPIGAEVTDWA